MKKIPLHRWPPTYIFSWWIICIVLFSIAGCCTNEIDNAPLYKTGEIIYNALDPDMEFPFVILRNDSRYAPRYKVRGTEAFFDPEWWYEGEIRDEDGKRRYRRKKEK